MIKINFFSNFPFEFYLRSLRFKLSDEKFGKLVDRDIAINYYLNSLMISGETDTAKYYSKK